MSIFFKILFFVVLSIVTLLSLTASPVDGPQGTQLTRMIAEFFLGNATHADKVGHFLGYGALGFFFSAAMFLPIRKLWIALIALGLYGGLLEYLQYLGGTRYGEVWDAVANLTGVAAGIIGFLLLAFLARKMLR